MDLPTLTRSLITANHILHSHTVLDAYGHISVRHPSDPTLFLMSRYLPACLVSSATDMVAYRVQNAKPMDESAPKGYSERFIHSEVYKQFPEVGSVCHSHAREVVPWGLLQNQAGLRACVNTSGFLGEFH
jgi:ribulose-5-phosphate 4-epimerase/fuculose-1-phosphate aldolase